MLVNPPLGLVHRGSHQWLKLLQTSALAIPLASTAEAQHPEDATPPHRLLRAGNGGRSQPSEPMAMAGPRPRAPKPCFSSMKIQLFLPVQWVAGLPEGSGLWGPTRDHSPLGMAGLMVELEQTEPWSSEVAGPTLASTGSFFWSSSSATSWTGPISWDS